MTLTKFTIKLALTATLAVADAHACRLAWDYPDDAMEPTRFLVYLNNNYDTPAAVADKSARSVPCEEWYSGYTRGVVQVAAEYGEPGADLYQIERSERLRYKLTRDIAGFAFIGEPFDLRVAEPE